MASCVLLDGNAPADEDHLYELPQSVVQRWFEDGRYGRIGTIGDGSCFFHSICYALDTRGYIDATRQKRREMVQKLRRGLARKLTETDYTALTKQLVGSRGPKAYGDIIRDLETPSTWAEETMIRWTSKTLGLNIVFLNVSDNRNDMYCGVHDKSVLSAITSCGAPEVPTVIVAWVDSAHFELVVRIDGVGPNGVRIRRCFQPDDADDQATVRQLMQAYAQACKA